MYKFRLSYVHIMEDCKQKINYYRIQIQRKSDSFHLLLLDFTTNVTKQITVNCVTVTKTRFHMCKILNDCV